MRERRFRGCQRKLSLVALFAVVLLVVRITPLQVRLDCGLTVVETVMVFLLVCVGGSLLYDTLFHWRELWPPNAGRR